VIESYMLNHPWLVILIWIVLYTGDHYLTIIGARLHRKQNIFEFEGSYELTPECQSDIDGQPLILPY
jgi:hypothetical protein